MIRAPHLKLIARHSVRHGVRGGAGLISILATLALGLILASIVISPLEQVERMRDQMEARHQISPEDSEQLTSRMTQEVTTLAKKTMSFAMGVADEQIDYLTTDKPAMISAILVLLMLITPLCACLAAFNQTSGDIATKGLRYLLIRTERANIFVGRFIGTFLFTAVVNALLFLILAIYIAIKIKVHPTGDMMLWLAGGYLRVMMFALPYVALCALISGSIDSSFGSLCMALLVAYVIPLIVRIGQMNVEGFKYVNYVTPWGYKWWLFSESPLWVLLGVIVMLVFTGAIMWLGNLRFTKRDL